MKTKDFVVVITLMGLLLIFILLYSKELFNNNIHEHRINELEQQITSLEEENQTLIEQNKYLEEENQNLIEENEYLKEQLEVQDQLTQFVTLYLVYELDGSIHKGKFSKEDFIIFLKTDWNIIVEMYEDGYTLENLSIKYQQIFYIQSQIINMLEDLRDDIPEMIIYWYENYDGELDLENWVYQETDWLLYIETLQNLYNQLGEIK